MLQLCCSSSSERQNHELILNSEQIPHINRNFANSSWLDFDSSSSSPHQAVPPATRSPYPDRATPAKPYPEEQRIFPYPDQFGDQFTEWSYPRDDSCYAPTAPLSLRQAESPIGSTSVMWATAPSPQQMFHAEADLQKEFYQASVPWKDILTDQRSTSRTSVYSTSSSEEHDPQTPLLSGQMMEPPGSSGGSRQPVHHYSFDTNEILSLPPREFSVESGQLDQRSNMESSPKVESDRKSESGGERIYQSENCENSQLYPTGQVHQQSYAS